MGKDIKIGIIGFGNMGAAFGTALRTKLSKSIYIYDQDKGKVSKQKGFTIVKNSRELIRKSDVVILAIKPQDISAFLGVTKTSFLEKNPLLITIAAGVSTEFFEEAIKGIRVVRGMPNLAAAVGQALSFICKGKFIKKKDLEIAKLIFSSVGEVIETNEDYMDKVTSITGSGLGYVYYFMDCLYESAVRLGFDEKTARTMVIQTFLGAVNLIKTRKDDFKDWIKKVSSKGGTTEAALNIWEKNNLSDLIDRAVKVAYLKARELNNGG